MDILVILWLSVAMILSVSVAIVVYMYVERDKPTVCYIPNCFAPEDIDEDKERGEAYRPPPPEGPRPPPLAAKGEPRRSRVSRAAVPTAGRLTTRKFRRERTADRRRGDAFVLSGMPREPDPAAGVRRDPRTVSSSARVKGGVLGVEPSGPRGGHGFGSSEGSDSEDDY